MADTETSQAEAPEAEARPAPAKRRGRPSKARGAANSSDKAAARWTVRGVPTNVREIAMKSAETRGLTMGDWLAEAVVAYAKSDKNGLSADGKGGLPALDQLPDLIDTVTKMSERLTDLEKQRSVSLFGRLFRKG